MNPGAGAIAPKPWVPCRMLFYVSFAVPSADAGSFLVRHFQFRSETTG